VMGWLFTGWLFHRFQRRTPATWRNHSWRRILVGIAVNDILFGFIFAAFFDLVGGIGRFNIDNWIGMGITFGAGCWGAIALPMCLAMTVFMQIHRGVIIGILLDWLASSVAAGLICAFVFAR
jgi:hypothetical protein